MSEPGVTTLNERSTTAAFVKGVKNRDRLAEPYRPNLNDSANEERSSSGSLLT